MRYGYARVSTTDQNLDTQLKALKDDGCERVFSEKISGVSKNKPEFEKMMREVRPGDMIVVYSFSRISRSLVDLIQQANKFKEIGVMFKSLTEPIDTSTPMGQNFLILLGALAEVERNILKERVKDGMKAARARGKAGGKPPILDEKQVARLKQLHTEGNISIKELCNMFGIKKPTLYKYLNK